ncbi:MtrAB system histidine kinase MtrB [Jatrophihabitans telluris]|uniref:Sensor histidine kinase MtrB n=1 Tax=Jatrophihabitans telluris TaxID=2038343 RepID=A0ABY4QV41_9ACTN|nr:MtrAB system histidine kinase MtrB [Jatrophihabitans telluris]UQX87528.1 MtrAB system histidine kinase MtrB [Jatrophihabitans telluris]
MTQRRATLVARRAWSAAGRAAVALGRRLRRSWRRSLQFRVAISTVVVTGAVVVLIGLFLIDQIGNGILKAKRDAAVSQASSGLDAARAHFAGVGPSDYTGIRQAVDQLTTDLTSSANDAGLFTVVVRSPDASVDKQLGSGPAIPADLRSTVRTGVIAVAYAPVTPPNQRHVPGLIVGEPVSTRAGSFEVYYLFPLTAEADTINLVRRTALVAGTALVLLVAAIAALVTRQVVRPVRTVAQIAERFAAGELSQRVKVSGEDDIALLAVAFNDMATSLQQQIQRLEQLSRYQQRFTSDVSHELRTPLTTVRMAAELLYTSRDEFDAALARSAELLINELDRFENLLADLLEISRYDAGAARLESERVDFTGIVERAVAASSSLAERHRTKLRLETTSQPLPVDVDARRVERILRNLIANGLDHAEGKPVIVTIGWDEEAVAVTVRDHGVGLRPGEAGLVFNRFWRGDPSRSRLTGGTGLGLAISLEDARLHGGWLQAWGERGKGANFRLTLPRTAGHPVTSSPLPLTPVEVNA